MLWALPALVCSSNMMEPHWRGDSLEALYHCEGPPSSLLPRGLECPEFPGIPSCWAKCPWTLPSSSGVPVPLRLPKSTHFSLSLGCRLRGPTHRSYYPVSLVSSTPHMHCVCALVRMARAGYLAVLGSLSLPAPTPLLPLGAWVRGARVLPGCSLYLTPFARR